MTGGRMWAQLEARIRRLERKSLSEFIIALAAISIIMVNTIWLLDYLSKN